MPYLYSCANFIFGYQSRVAKVVSRTFFRSTLRALLVAWITMSVPAAWAAAVQTVTTLVISNPSGPNPSVSYQVPITLTASVTDGVNPVTSGLVLFCDASAAVCENNSALGLVQLTSSGATATLKVGSGALGVHKYMAVYRANNNYLSSTSNTVSYTVIGKYASTTTIGSTGTVGAYTLSSTVAGIGSVFLGPTGNVSFLDTSAGNNVLGSEALGASVLSTTFSEASGSPFDIATSSTPKRSVAIASAYLNADNNLDVVTGDYSQTITVLLGNGDGTFQTKVNYTGCPSGGIAMKILLADFNRDGNTDVALGCSTGTTGSLTILLGNGDGTFNAPTSFAAGDVAGIAIGDFNGDGIIDFAVSNHQQQNIMIFTGVGDGTFNTPVTVLSPSSELHDVVVADFNGDGNDDLLYAINTAVNLSQLSDLYLATGVGDGTFNTPTLIASQVGEFLTTGDTNGDNIPDVVSTTITGSQDVGQSLFVLIGKADAITGKANGTFKPTVTYTSDIPSDPHLTDVNGDGRPDIIAGGSFGALVYLGNGDGTFQAYTEPTIGNFALTYAVNAGDFNNDGNADLIGTDADTPRAAVSLSQVQQSASAAALAGIALYPLGSGTHNVDASYSGDATYLTSASSTVALLAAPTPTTLGLAVSPTSATLTGQSVVLTATLSPFAVGPPTTTTDGERVAFYNGTHLLGHRTLTGGVATLTTSSLTLGSHPLSVVYGGDPNYDASTSSTMTVTVATIVLTSSLNPSTYSQPVTFTATLVAGATGSVTFMDGATTLGTGTISSGVATFTTTSNLAVALHNITGVYSGDGSHSAATSPVLVQEVDKNTPVVNVTTSGASIYGAPVTITTTLPVGATGTVTVTSGTTTIGTGSVGTNGTFVVTTSSLPASLPGSPDPISVSYGGDGNYNSASGSTNQTVGKASPTLPAPVLNPSSPAAGAQVTITETVPTGVLGPVTFYDGGTAIGTGAITGGIATLTMPSLPVGTDTITASTPGDTNNNPATSPGTTVTIVKNSPTLPAPVLNPSSPVAGEQVTITETVPTGVLGPVTFYDGGTAIGTGTISGGIATLTVPLLPVGTDTITASTPGDANNNPATSPGTTVTIVKNSPTVTVTAPSSSTYGSPVTITATVSGVRAGTVTITSGGVTLGSDKVDSTGAVSITTSSLPAGTDTITANYGGDRNNNPASGSATTTVSMTTPTVSVTTSGPSTYGSPVTVTATLLPAGATGTVTFTSGGATLGSGTVSAGTATVTTSSLPVGSDTITANYGGDSNDNPASNTTTQIVSKASPTLQAPGVNPSSPITGSSVTITETVPTGVSGPVTFSNGGTVLGTAPITGGIATLTVPSLPVGTVTITASTPGDGNNNPATSPGTTVTVGKKSPTLPAPVLNPSSPTAGVSVTITETVPTGVSGPVTFYDGGAAIGTGVIVGGVATLTVPSLPVGTDTITASTPGDANNNPATSPGTVVTVIKNSPTLPPPVANPSNAVLGATVTITETVPTGVSGPVTFYNGGTAIGTGTITGGIATITVTTLPLGSNTITASTPGDANNYPATSPGTTVLVNRTAPTVTVTTTGPSTYGSPVTITASVPAGPTGTMTFTSGGVTLGSGTVSAAGTVTITTSALPVGSDTITANYGGDSNNAAASGSTTQTVSQIITTVTVTTTGPSTYGSPVTITASVPPGTTGTVTITSGGATLGSGTVSPTGTVSVTTSNLPVGGDTITASYSGDTNDAPGSGSTTQTVNKNSPTLPPPGVSSTNVDATTQVTITETVPTGVSGPVTFYDGGVPIGTGAIVGGVATLTVPSLPVGSDPITASTPGDANNNPATSPATTVNVVKVTPVLAPPVVTPNNPMVGATVTISETVPTGVTGPVTFYNGGTVIGTGTAVNGVATITTSTLPIGSDPITASTQSNASYNSATSPATNANVVKSVGSVTLTASANPATLNQPVTFTAAVTSGATGSVTFYDGATVLGVGTISSAGIATFTTSSLTSGTHPITAAFAGDSNYSAATSATLSEVVNRTPTTIVLTESSPMQLVSSMVTFTANVTAPTPTPTGMITFYDGSTALGTAPMSTDGTAVVSLALSGSAAFATSSLTSGSHQITASYSGDTGFMPSTSAPVANIVADFTNVATGATEQKMFPGGTTSYTFVLTPVGASTFLNDTTLTIAGLPTGTTYTFSPAVIKAGSGPTTVTLSLTTSSTLKAANHAPAAPGSAVPGSDGGSHGGVPASLAILGLAGMGAVRRYRKQMPRLMMMVLLTLASLLPIAAMTGCAGGYFALDPNTYSIQVTGTEGPIQHTATTTLVVQ
jgi:hypothetical protein